LSGVHGRQETERVTMAEFDDSDKPNALLEAVEKLRDEAMQRASVAFPSQSVPERHTPAAMREYCDWMTERLWNRGSSIGRASAMLAIGIGSAVAAMLDDERAKPTPRPWKRTRRDWKGRHGGRREIAQLSAAAWDTYYLPCDGDDA
jgi:hypothetical protein